MDQYIKEHLSELQHYISVICEIPSPTGKEVKKAEYILRQLHQWGATDAYIDEIGNVLYAHRSMYQEEESSYTLFCAHIDTVFMDLEEIRVSIKDGKLYAPSAYGRDIHKHDRARSCIDNRSEVRRVGSTTVAG